MHPDGCHINHPAHVVTARAISAPCSAEWASRWQPAQACGEMDSLALPVMVFVIATCGGDGAGGYQPIMDWRGRYMIDSIHTKDTTILYHSSIYSTLLLYPTLLARSIECAYVGRLHRPGTCFCSALFAYLLVARQGARSWFASLAQCYSSLVSRPWPLVRQHCLACCPLGMEDEVETGRDGLLHFAFERWLASTEETPRPIEAGLGGGDGLHCSCCLW